MSETWLDLLCSGAADSAPVRRAVAERWMSVAVPPPYWMKLKFELRDLHARLEDADDALYVRGDLDSRRHALIVERFSIKIAQTQDALSAIEPRIDTRRLLDRDYAIRRWNEHAAAGHRDLLRLAWSHMLLVKAVKPGGSFGEGRIVYVPVESTDGSLSAATPMVLGVSLNACGLCGQTADTREAIESSDSEPRSTTDPASLAAMRREAGFHFSAGRPMVAAFSDDD